MDCHGCRGFSEKGQLGLVQGSVWSPDWEEVTISIVCVVSCQLGGWSVMNPLWVSVSTPMKQRDWFNTDNLLTSVRSAWKGVEAHWAGVYCLHSSLGWSVSFLYPKVRTRMVISALAPLWGCP